MADTTNARTSMTPNRQAVIDEAIVVATKLPAVQSFLCFWEDANGNSTRNPEEVARVCINGAIRLAIHRLYGVSYGEAKDIETSLRLCALYASEEGGQAVEENTIAQYLQTLKEN